MAITHPSRLLAPILAIAALSGGEAAPLSPCDKQVTEAVSVTGLNPAFHNPHTGPTVPSFGFATADMAAAVDPTVANFMNEYAVPGGAVAITYADKLIFAKAYGYLDLGNAFFAEPDTRYRTASVSKAVTAMSVLKLVHDGALKLTDQPFPFAGVPGIIAGTLPGNLFPGGQSSPGNPNYNKQLSKITVGELLHHAGGWNRDAAGAPDLTGYDVLQGLASYLTVRSVTPSGPPDCTALLGYVESQPLQFAPGTQTQYSNVGFCALSEVVAETSGMAFPDFLAANVLSPLGMVDTGLGATPFHDRQDRESVYYDFTDPPSPSLFPPYATVSAPYSSIGAIEAQEGAAAIVSTAIDLAHFAGAIGGGKLKNFPGPPSFPDWPQAYYSLSALLPGYECTSDIPPFPTSKACPASWNPANHQAYGAGWDFTPPHAVATPFLPYDDFNFLKDGGYPGTVSSLAVTADGYGFAAVFNGNDNTVPAPQDLIFWPGCNTAQTPAPAATPGNCALQAAYNHTGGWTVDFSADYAAAYTGWMAAPAFAAYLATQRAVNSFPARLEGREEASIRQYRGRFATAGAVAPKFAYGQTCTAILHDIRTAPTATPLVSLQRFFDTGAGAFLYQAVWSAPIP